MKFIDPRIDFAFKKIFGGEDTKEILISFLESLMGLHGDKCIKEIQILDPYLAPKIQEMKYSVLDVKCVDRRGVHYVVEMQIRKVRAFLKRIQYNAAKAYVNQIASAEDYPKLNQVIAITITDFTLFDEFEHYVSLHETKEQISGQVFLNEIVHYFVELSKFPKGLDDLHNVLDKWVFFIKEASKLETIPDRLNEEPFCHAFEKARVANMDQEEFERYEKAGMVVADARGAIELALEEGEIKGLRKGEIKGLREGEIKGERKGEMKLLLRLLQHKFTNVPPWVDDKITNADLATLETWSFKVLEAQSLQDVFGSAP